MPSLSGKRVTVYSVVVDDAERTLFGNFLKENLETYRKELENINQHLHSIAHKTGIRDSFFEKPEGKLGQDIWAICDKPGNRLRLYCMQLGHVVIILGGGGPKPKTIRALQEDPKLLHENGLMRTISDAITLRMQEREIFWKKNGLELDGDFVFDDNDDDE